MSDLIRYRVVKHSDDTTTPGRFNLEFDNLDVKEATLMAIILRGMVAKRAGQPDAKIDREAIFAFMDNAPNGFTMGPELRDAQPIWAKNVLR